ncbi:hypothetical protein [Spirulina sp. 06S082]|uniref:hypothetical protein n=1 Tax=Spirulina sp. 06S082 TaxID=3110248 RepID=UPI002B1F8770|nr:hypothetical protein [Spirulina sp. 06S082]MEA5467478.1 hypothetical protein [Spirulina sp. 06S082]
MTQTHSSEKTYSIYISDAISKDLEQIANGFNLSISGLLENLASGKLVAIESEELEDFWDLQDAIAAEQNPENQERIPWEKVKQELGL